LSDPPREDSRAYRSITQPRRAYVMVTGDAPMTARVVADAVGITGPNYATVPLPHDIKAEEFGVFAGILPEDKYALIQAFQRGVMWSACAATALMMLRRCGRLNGIAVFTATDVAKYAAGIY